MPPVWRRGLKQSVKPWHGGRDDLEDDPDPCHDGEPIIDRRQGEWRRPSYRDAWDLPARGEARIDG